MTARTVAALRTTEAQLTADVCDMAAKFGLHIAHFRPARTERGWRTAVQGNGGKGFPDVIAWGPGGLLVRELKQDGAYPDPTQRQRLAELEEAGADVGVWRPKDWRSGRIENELRALRWARSEPAPQTKGEDR